MARRPAVHEMITSRKAPKPIGPYVHAVKIEQPGAMLFVSGQIPIEVPSGQVFRGDIKRQAEIAFDHLKNIVIDGGFALDEVVKCTIFLTDLESFDKVNQVYQKIFVGMNLPARAVVQVSGLPKEVDIEVEAIAVKKGAAQDEMFRDMDFQ
ncbi:MAG: Rid family detoxifying hydrolase [Myxococcota bacterium]|jgi:2-iminobutanoate/2-iminopropanoate deaminase|nr:Rid family detoxifying hydrolase [Myxococcota bacterium]